MLPRLQSNCSVVQKRVGVQGWRKQRFGLHILLIVLRGGGFLFSVVQFRLPLRSVRHVFFEHVVLCW